MILPVSTTASTTLLRHCGSVIVALTTYLVTRLSWSLTPVVSSVCSGQQHGVTALVLAPQLGSQFLVLIGRVEPVGQHLHRTVGGDVLGDHEAHRVLR